jgi:hypothetical protein
MIRAFHHLSIPVPEGWSQEITVTASGNDTLRLTPPAPPGCTVVFLPEVNLPSSDPETVLVSFVAGHIQGRETLASSPDRFGTTAQGLPWAMRETASRGEGVWYCMYWALAVAGRVQCAVVCASSKQGYDALLPKIGPLFDEIQARPR